MSNDERRAALKLWLEERRVTWKALADAMGVSPVFVRVMLMERDTIPARRHKQMLTLGIPEELLPAPFAGAFGRPKRPLEGLEMPAPLSTTQA